LELKSEEQFSDFHCVEGWSIDKLKWKSVRLRTLFDMAGLKPEATPASFHPASGIYIDSLSIKDALESEVMLAYMKNGELFPENRGCHCDW
jgi:sulfoxide reductase catalytic subunit YedY